MWCGVVWWVGFPLWDTKVLNGYIYITMKSESSGDLGFSVIHYLSVYTGQKLDIAFVRHSTSKLEYVKESCMLICYHCCDMPK